MVALEPLVFIYRPQLLLPALISSRFVSRFDSDRSYSIDFRQCHHQQSTSEIIAEFIKYRYVDASRKSYACNNIVVDMNRDYGVTLNKLKKTPTHRDNLFIFCLTSACGNYSCSKNSFSTCTLNLGTVFNTF
ncbi:unnamed protein product [Cuscuta epithymum]|uniref:Uncharacterized protein n=1 Tax=Cuscuta epithymum TaxID=186058 RepID=A0AAV0DSW3_9ASTE|nr:unnamed protein product [Cuscuta epithymum]